MAKKQPVYQEVAADARLYLSDFQRYAATEAAVITFKFGKELYHVDQNQLTLSYLAADSAPVDPLLAFRDLHGFPYFEKGDLKEMPGGVAGGDPPFFRVERQKGGVAQLQLYSWASMVAELSRVVGRDASERPDTTLRGLLVYRGGVPPEYLEVASRSQEDDETFGQALIRLDFAQPRDLLFAALGGSRLFNPTCHMSNAIGRKLLDQGAITRADLTAALKDQVKSGKSLAAILHKQGACTGESIAKAFEAVKGETIFLPPTDKMGEMLVRSGKVSRTELMSGVFKVQGTDQTIAEFLVEEDLCSEAEIAKAEAWHDAKMRLRTTGKVRIGQILLEDGAVTIANLEKALLIQIERPDPLGEILIAEGLASPEAVIEALLEQETRLNEWVAAAVSGADNGIADLPLFDVPPSTLKGGKVKKKKAESSEDGQDGDADTDRPKGLGKLTALFKRDPKAERAVKAPKGKGAAVGEDDEDISAEGEDDDGDDEAGAARRAKADESGKAAAGASKAARHEEIERLGKRGRPGAKDDDAEDDDADRPKQKLQWKPLVGAAVIIAAVSGLAYAVVTQTQPGGLLAQKPKAAAAAASPSPSVDPLAGMSKEDRDTAELEAQIEQAKQGGGLVPQGSLRDQAAQSGQLRGGDKTSMSHLSNAELAKIAKKNPGFVTADDVENRGGRIGETLEKAAKTDKNIAMAVKAAKITSGAQLLNKELNTQDGELNPEMAKIEEAGVANGPPGAARGGSRAQAAAQAQSGAAASFRSADEGATGGAGETSGQFARAAGDDLAPAAIQDSREQLSAFAGEEGGGPRAAAGQGAPRTQGALVPPPAQRQPGGQTFQAPPRTQGAFVPPPAQRQPGGQTFQAPPRTQGAFVPPPAQRQPGGQTFDQTFQAPPRTQGAFVPSPAQRQPGGQTFQAPPGQRQAAVQTFQPDQARQVAAQAGAADQPPAATQLAPPALPPIAIPDVAPASRPPRTAEKAAAMELAASVPEAQDGIALIGAGRPAEAEKALRAAQAARPAEPVVSHSLAVALLAQKKVADAVPLLAKSQAGLATRAGSELTQAELAYHQQDFPTAKYYLRTALLSQTLSASGQARLSTILKQQGKGGEATRLARDSAASYSTAGRIHAQLAEIYVREGNPQQAIIEWTAAAQLDPYGGRAWFELGREALAQKRNAQARKYLRVALSREPSARWSRTASRLLSSVTPPKPKPKPAPKAVARFEPGDSRLHLLAPHLQVRR
jgi:tetratricopeptide (TPR) repeat protein